jgi:hypothetical protein
MKKALRIGMITAVLNLALIAFILPVWSQDQPADNMELIREKIKADKKLIVAAAMQLTDSEADKFWPLYDQFQQELDKLADRTRKLIENFAANFADMNDATAKELLDEHMRLQSDRVKFLETYLPKFRSVLPEPKVARYYQVENKIHAVVAYEHAREIPLIR